MAKDLTIKALDNLKPGPARREVPDGHTRGLFYVLQPSGSASWAYRYRFAGKTKKLTPGPYPALDLKASRQMASEAAQTLARGDDPAAAKQVAKLTARAAAEPDRDLIEIVVETFIERYAKKQTAQRRGARRNAFSIANRRALARTAPLDGQAGRRSRTVGQDSRSRRADCRGSDLAALRRMCSWAVERGLVEANPCDKVRAPSAETSRDRVLTDDEIRAAWAAFEGVGWPFGPLTQLLLLTGARLREVGEARWSEIDLAAKTWTIPKERAKNGARRSPSLRDGLAGFGRIAPDRSRTLAGGLYFQGKWPFRHIGFLARKGSLRQGDSGDGGAPMPHWTMHDLRRTGASGMAGLGIAPHVVEAVLNHKGGSIKGVAAVYNRYSYATEKRAALDAWGGISTRSFPARQRGTSLNSPRLGLNEASP